MIGKNLFQAFLFYILLSAFSSSTAQTIHPVERPAVPFLQINPDARTAAIGEAGAATTPDANSLNSNSSKLAFIESKYGFSLAYSPWLKSLVPDMYLSYLSAFYRLSDRNTIGASVRYFSMGEIQLTDDNMQSLGSYRPNDIAIDITMARRFGDSFSLGGSLRYIQSGITATPLNNGQSGQTLSALAVDFSAYYQQQRQLFGKTTKLSAGLALSNVGTKMNYPSGDTPYFLPANAKLGFAAGFGWLEDSQFTLAFDLNKQLLPTGTDDPLTTDVSVASAIVKSFGDAPGGFKEEWSEVSMGGGIEYLHKQQFAIRAGYLYKNPEKGDFSYLTAGVGFRYQFMNIDFAYIIANQQKNPLGSSLRFTLLLNFN
ncbi:type IX secretion system outer membrane channel protein PorV [Pedobacter sp.]|uniref:type IX secretion system outer membrane channel protein PorV n=1 Tax=Pedobacter sp. TaxID=1411316 RepID=UPI003D7FD150